MQQVYSWCSRSRYVIIFDFLTISDPARCSQYYYYVIVIYGVLYTAVESANYYSILIASNTMQTIECVLRKQAYFAAKIENLKRHRCISLLFQCETVYNNDYVQHHCWNVSCELSRSVSETCRCARVVRGVMVFFCNVHYYNIIVSKYQTTCFYSIFENNISCRV